MARITESTFCESAPRVNAETGVIAGVKLIGLESRNGRKYPASVLASSLSCYEGARCFIDHPDRKAGVERSVRDWAGTVRGVRVQPDGLYGDLHLLTKREDASMLLEAAESHWQNFGLSHVADCKITRENGQDVVQAIEEVFSVDIVTDPATTRGLFESKDRAMKTTVQKVIESTKGAKASARKIVQEMLAADEELGAVEMEVPAEDATPDDSIAAAFSAAIMAVVNDSSLDLAGKKSKINEILKAQEKVEGAADPPASSDSGGESDGESDAPTEEGRKLNAALAKLATMEAKTLLLESGREATAARIKALASAPEADRKELLESWPATTVKESVSRRPLVSPPAGGDSTASTTYESKHKQRVEEARKKLAARSR